MGWESEMKREVKVVVFDNLEYDGTDWPPQGAAGFMAWFWGKLESVPTEYLEAARIEVTPVPGYEGASHVNIEISYMRPETDEEGRQTEDVLRARAEATRKRELETLARLQAKYGSGT